MTRLRSRRRANDAGDEFVIPPEFADVQSAGPPAPPEPLTGFGPLADPDAVQFPDQTQPGYTGNPGFGPLVDQENFPDQNQPGYTGDPNAGYGPRPNQELFPDQNQPGYTGDPNAGYGPRPNQELFPNQNQPGYTGDPNAPHVEPGGDDAGDAGPGFNWNAAGKIVGTVVDAAGRVVEVAVRRSDNKKPEPDTPQRVPTGVYLLRDGTLWWQMNNEAPPRGARRMRQTQKGWTPEDGEPVKVAESARPSPPRPGSAGRPGEDPPYEKKKSSGVWLWLAAGVALLAGR